MSHADELIRKLDTNACREQLRTLYGGDELLLKAQQERYASVLRRHAELFGEKADLQLISAPGRTEIGGNHTDIITGGCSWLR